MGLLSWLSGRPDSDDLSRAALNVVQEYLHVGSVWPGDSGAVIEQMQEKITAARQWTSTVGERQVRRAYEGWLDFYQKRVDEARAELTNHARQKRMAKYDTEFRERWRRASEIEKNLPRPAR